MLASLLLVAASNSIRVYSLWHRPVVGTANLPSNQDKRLVEILDLTSEALSALTGTNLISSIESGQYFENHQAAFDRRTRIDSTLLNNLRITHQNLVKKDLSSDAARALLLQIIFIAYLEDRKIIDAEYYAAALPGENIHSLAGVLGQGDESVLSRLFFVLRRHFNGDIFYAPSSFDPTGEVPPLHEEHLAVLALFRSGIVKLESGQGRFWPYDFAFIPVELISAIYDRFLNDSDERRRAMGAYYTPRFLADLAVASRHGKKLRNGLLPLNHCAFLILRVALRSSWCASFSV